ncbi:MAG: hypothetical protein IJQ10_02100 [Clostridia bacterium]|nr:hypothetical protein [Clostridia bacterium]
MILLIILVTIAIVLIILLFCPFNISIFFDNKIESVKASVFFFKFDIYKKKTNKPKKINSKKSKSNKKTALNYFKIIKKTPKIIKLVIECLKIIFKNLNLKKAYILIKISSSDARDSALKYSVIQSAIDLISNNSKLMPGKIKIFSYPCFYSDKMQVKSQIEFEFLGIKFLHLLLKILFKLATMARLLRE